MFNSRYFNFFTILAITSFLSLTNAAFCSNLTSTNDKDTACFLESAKLNPALLRTSSSSLILPCHVARSKRATVEWWYQDFLKTINIKIYPMYPTVRPTVFRFITSTPVSSPGANETDLIDVSILLRHVNVDDSGIYRCVIRSWSDAPMTNIEDNFWEENPTLPTLSYHVELSGPRICQTEFDKSPCFQKTRTTSPAIINAYQVAFLQCVVQNKKHKVFWVLGNATENSALIIDHLISNQHNGDRLRRLFPTSQYDYSIELTVNNDTRERTYSCVIDRFGELEATLFTYIIRPINLETITDRTIKTHKNATTPMKESEKKIENIIPHDALAPQEIDELREKSTHEHVKSTKHDNDNDDDDDTDLPEFYVKLS
ncbi:unnamed protein product [Adineta steineri]|uniref:Ig-like domain-containing protein n=1 Tax=Adineta steineri TaxID=433720 RepID=A0A813MWV9_9BILA|nr:unnamed protein product [Adineta steineri]CAF0794197.1 unnamed protein product [Adineta steineri]CAF0798406.1 unnamed protein product [Adineta steineri]